MIQYKAMILLKILLILVIGISKTDQKNTMRITTEIVITMKKKKNALRNWKKKLRNWKNLKQKKQKHRLRK